MTVFPAATNEHDDGIKTWSHEGGWLVSQNEVWVHGVYETEKAAIEACSLSLEHPEDFATMQQRINYILNENRLIAEADLAEFKQQMEADNGQRDA